MDLQKLLHHEDQSVYMDDDKDRLNTKDMFQRRPWNISDGTDCILCPTHVREGRDHLFFMCNSSMRIWNYLQVSWPGGNDMCAIANQARKEFAKLFC